MKKGFSILFLIPVLFFSITISNAQSDFYTSPCTELIWQDEFDGTSLDAAKWDYQLGDGCPTLCGWGNGELQYYTSNTQNVNVQNGTLSITALQESMGGKNYTSGRIITENKGDFTFGRIEARIKLPIGQGLWPAFWMLPTDRVYGSWPHSGEIDIMEYQGFAPSTASGTLHFVNENLQHTYKPAVHFLSGNNKYSDDFHIFSIEWDSTTIRWFVDNTNFHTVTKDQIAPANWPFKHRFYILLNVALGGLGGTPNASTVFPQTMEVDYVRVYSLPVNQTLYGPKRVFSEDVTSYYTPGDLNIFDGHEWVVPAGATITSGQGTNSIEVEWGNTSGNVVFRTGLDCDTFDFNYPVTVFDRNSCDILFTDFENVHYPQMKSSWGGYIENMDNPFPDAFNGSAKATRYKKKNTGNNILTYINVPLEGALEYESESKRFYMDVHTPVEVGSKIKLHMQCGAKATGGYPAGIRNTFIGTITQSNQWHRVYFMYKSTDDASVLPSEIDEVVFNFDPDHVDTKVLFIDNFSRVNIGAGCVTSSVMDKTSSTLVNVYPNPAKQAITLELNSTIQHSDLTIMLCNSLGEIVVEQKIASTDQEINIQMIPSGMYFINVQSEEQVYSGKFVKE